MPLTNADGGLGGATHAFWVLLPLPTAAVLSVVPEAFTLNTPPSTLPIRLPPDHHPILIELGRETDYGVTSLPKFTRTSFNEVRIGVPYVTPSGSRAAREGLRKDFVYRGVIYLDHGLTAATNKVGIPGISPAIESKTAKLEWGGQEGSVYTIKSNGDSSISKGMATVSHRMKKAYGSIRGNSAFLNPKAGESTNGEISPGAPEEYPKEPSSANGMNENTLSPPLIKEKRKSAASISSVDSETPLLTARITRHPPVPKQGHPMTRVLEEISYMPYVGVDGKNFAKTRYEWEAMGKDITPVRGTVVMRDGILNKYREKVENTSKDTEFEEALGKAFDGVTEWVVEGVEVNFEWRTAIHKE